MISNPAAASPLSTENLSADAIRCAKEIREHVFIREYPVSVSPQPSSEGSVKNPSAKIWVHHAAWQLTKSASLKFAQRPGLVLAGLFALFLLAAAVQPSWFAAWDPLEANARAAFRAPSALHWLGTDENGRDVLTRVIYGVRPSLIMGFGATAIGVTLGVLFGLTAGLSHRAVDAGLMRLVDVVLAFPELLLALLFITFWGQGTSNAIVAIGVASVPRYARLIRAQAQQVRRSSYVEAAITLGLRPSTVILRHVLPNSIKPVLILATIGVGGKIAAGAALSFLGLGAPPPAPEWGSMLSVGRNFLANAPWLTAVPGLAVTLTVLSISAIGRELMRRSEGKITS